MAEDEESLEVVGAAVKSKKARSAVMLNLKNLKCRKVVPIGGKLACMLNKIKNMTAQN